MFPLNKKKIYNEILGFDWLFSDVAMVVAIEWQVATDDKFYEIGLIIASFFIHL